MIVIEYDKIELDYCTECSGIWFDAGEIELLLDTTNLDVINQSLQSPEARTAEKERRCPTCGKKMEKRKLGESSPVLLDVCPNGGGLWFDSGEINQFVQQLPEKDSGAISNRILSFIQNVVKPANQ